ALHEPFEDALPCFVVHDEVVDRIAFRRRVFGVAADVEVEASAVFEEHVARPAPRHHSAEQIAGDFVGAQAPLAAQRARNAIFVFEPEDAALHPDECKARPPYTCAVVPMTRLTSVYGSFAARVMAAHLEFEGFDVHLRGPVNGPYALTVGEM